MEDVVVGALLGAPGPHAADRLGSFQGLDLGLLIHAQHDRAFGWVQIESPTTSWTLAISCGSVKT